ncbi:50S ribosomal protein L13 [Geofilum rhodophaeum]|uniref:50S ribosomal protein L13 n=1 Tax=Geofilum rhodophaeum TaxID=1965019 RepID=UPI000B524FE8|nr:50S ribosomal protein L13 [Geofilum rhodophaeum]HHU57641.1 50S ribosomal protein L13 [Bacteroidales bacterium]
MDTLSYKTNSATPATIQKEWLVVDASDMILGRLGSEVAKLLRGKHKPNYTPNLDCGDNVIIVNADKVKLSGKKWDDRVFFYHSGYPGGQREVTPAMLFAKSPERLVERTVKGMLPKTKLGRKLFGNLFVYAGPEHKQEAQQPRVIELNKIK